MRARACSWTPLTIGSATTIPMHYRTRALGLVGLMFARVDKFLSAAGEPAREVQELSLDPATLADNAGIVVMKYQR